MSVGKKRRLILVLIGLCWLLPAGSTVAGPLQSKPIANTLAKKANKPAKANKIKNEQQAVRAAKRKYPGKLLRVNASAKGYRVKLLSKSGKVFTVYVDAQSGNVRKN